MVRELTQADRQAILDLAYSKERENLFLIGNLEFKEAFGSNRYFGSFQGKELRAVAAWSARFVSVVATGEQERIPEIVDAVMAAKLHIESVPAVEPYGSLIVRQLKVGGLTSSFEQPSVFMQLARADFHPFDFAQGLRPYGPEARQAQERDRDAIVLLQRTMHAQDLTTPVTDLERGRIAVEQTFVAEEEGQIVATATAAVRSRHYAQVVGVVTHPDFRRKGYAAGSMSALCQHAFVQGAQFVLLFTGKANLPAQALYQKLGFTVIGDFLHAEYS